MRIIDADALLNGHSDHEMISTHLIWNAPTIDAVEVVHGKWKRKIVDNGFNADWVCSKCGYRVMTDFVSYSYCPNCGAKMGTACTHVEEASDE